MAARPAGGGEPMAADGVAAGGGGGGGGGEGGGGDHGAGRVAFEGEAELRRQLAGVADVGVRDAITALADATGAELNLNSRLKNATAAHWRLLSDFLAHNTVVRVLQ